MSRQWIAFYTGDYLRDTRHLTAEQHGAYLLLLMECWTHGRIPMDPKQQAALVRVSAYRWHKLSPVILKFFREDGTNKRADREIEKVEAVRLTRSIAGYKGGSRSSQVRALAAAKRKQTASKCLSKPPSKNEAKAKPTTIVSKKETVTVEEGAVDNLPATEPAEPKRLAEKKPSELTRAELDQIYAQRREAKANPQPAAGAAP